MNRIEHAEKLCCQVLLISCDQLDDRFFTPPSRNTQLEKISRRVVLYQEKLCGGVSDEDLAIFVREALVDLTVYHACCVSSTIIE